MKKSITLEEILASYKDKDIEIPVKDGVFRVRLKAKKRKDLALFVRAKRGEATLSEDELAMEFTRRLEIKDGKEVEVEWTREEWGNLPPFLAQEIIWQLYQHLGLRLETEALKKISLSPYEEEGKE